MPSSEHSPGIVPRPFMDVTTKPTENTILVERKDELTEEAKCCCYCFERLYRYVGTIFHFSTTGLAYAICFLATMSRALSMASCQALFGFVPGFQLNFWRFIVQLLTVTPWVLAQKTYVIPEPSRRRKILGLLISGATMSISNMAQFESVLYIPIGNALGVQSAFAIFFTFIGGMLLKVKPWSWRTFVTVTFCILGCLLLSQPDIIFGKPEVSNRKDEYRPDCLRDTKSEFYFNGILWQLNATNLTIISQNSTVQELRQEYIGYLLCVARGLMDAILGFSVNLMLMDVDVFASNFSNGIFGTALSLIFASALETWVFPLSPMCLLFLFCHAFCIATASLCDQYSWRILKPMEVSLIRSLLLVYMFIFQYTILKDILPGRKNWIEVLGAVIVFLSLTVGNAYECIMQRIKERKSSEEKINGPRETQK